jgi:hypothetical protein
VGISDGQLLAYLSFFSLRLPSLLLYLSVRLFVASADSHPLSISRRDSTLLLPVDDYEMETPPPLRIAIVGGGTSSLLFCADQADRPSGIGGLVAAVGILKAMDEGANVELSIHEMRVSCHRVNLFRGLTGLEQATYSEVGAGLSFGELRDR